MCYQPLAALFSSAHCPGPFTLRISESPPHSCALLSTRRPHSVLHTDSVPLLPIRPLFLQRLTVHRVNPVSLAKYSPHLQIPSSELQNFKCTASPDRTTESGFEVLTNFCTKNLFPYVASVRKEADRALRTEPRALDFARLRTKIARFRGMNRV